MSPMVVFYVEGETERLFVMELLGPHLSGLGVNWTRPIQAAHSMKNGRTMRGGVLRYEPVKRDLQRLLMQYSKQDFILTTMLDFYGLPEDFPGFQSAKASVQSPMDRARAVEAAWDADLADYRFWPNLTLHEFEALILVKPDALLAAYPNMGGAVDSLKADVGKLNPEAIDDGVDSSPSKRIIKAFEAHGGRYDKVSGGNIAVSDIGLAEIRAQCRKFDSWVTRLEGLVTQGGSQVGQSL